MRYSWVFGEMTDGFEWYDGYSENMKAENKKGDGVGFIKLMSFLSLFLVSSYVAGAIISSGGEFQNEEVDEDYGEAVAVMSYGIVNTDNAMENDVMENEEDARISELAAAYIEEYMCENYGDVIEGEE